MKNKSGLFFLLVAFIFISLMVSGGLFIKNRLYKKENRSLILANDSVISVNIELKDTIDKIGKGRSK